MQGRAAHRPAGGDRLERLARHREHPERRQPWTGISLALIAPSRCCWRRWRSRPRPLRAVGFTGKFFGVALALAALCRSARRNTSEDDLEAWLWESWRFVKQIFRLLVDGVFIVGMILRADPPLSGRESSGRRQHAAGQPGRRRLRVFTCPDPGRGCPSPRMFLDLGMHRGRCCLPDGRPGLSLQSILIISAIIGRQKGLDPYVAWWPLFSTVAGLTYGAWMDGSSLLLALELAGFIAVLAALLSRWPAIGKPVSQTESDHVEHQGSRPGCANCRKLGRSPAKPWFPGRRGGDRQGHRHAADHRLRRAEDAQAGDQRSWFSSGPHPRWPTGSRRADQNLGPAWLVPARRLG